MSKQHRNPAKCPLCGRTTRLTFHHLIPKKVHRRAHFKKHHSKDELNQGIYVCRTCHNGIHETHDEMTLAKKFRTIAALRKDEDLARYFHWVGRQRIK